MLQPKPPIGSIPLSDIIKAKKSEANGDQKQPQPVQVKTEQPIQQVVTQPQQVVTQPAFQQQAQQAINFDSLGQDQPPDPVDFLKNPQQPQLQNMFPGNQQQVQEQKQTQPLFNQPVFPQQSFPQQPAQPMQPIFQQPIVQQQPAFPQPSFQQQGFQMQQPQMQQPAFQTQPQQTLFPNQQLVTQQSPQLPSVHGLTPPPTGFILANFGDSISRFPIDRDRFALGMTYRRGIIGRQIMIIKMHFEEGVGAFYCFGGKCCERNGIPQLRYVIPDIVYDADPQTAAPVSKNFDIAYLQLSEAQYKVQKALDVASPFEMMDYIIICQEIKYQKIQISAVGPALWRSDAEMAAAVMKKYQEVAKFIHVSIATTLTPEDYERKINQINTFYQNPQGHIDHGKQGVNLNQFLKR